MKMNKANNYQGSCIIQDRKTRQR